jgi:NADPH2:quinone reductase
VRAVEITAFGGPEVLTPADLPEPVPAEGQVLLRVRAAGVNFADAMQAQDAYLAPVRLPFVPGMEVAASTPDGRRVVAMLPAGGYAEAVAVHPEQLVAVPDGVDDDQALALLVQGATAWHLLRTSTRLEPGEVVVVHAAGGGVGTLAVQLARRWGAGRVVAAASTAAKRDLALSLGADAAVDLTGLDADGVHQVLREATGGRGADVVLDAAGGATTDGSLAALAPFGRLAVYGRASGGSGTAVDPSALLHGSRSVVGFWLAEIGALRHGLGPALDELMSLTATGLLRPVVGGHYPLEEASRAHADLRGRGTSGKLVLDVG